MFGAVAVRNIVVDTRAQAFQHGNRDDVVGVDFRAAVAEVNFHEAIGGGVHAIDDGAVVDDDAIYDE